MRGGGVVLIGCRFERYITTKRRNRNLSACPVIFKISKTQFLSETAVGGGGGGLERTAEELHDRRGKNVMIRHQ
jgi:hypothetical protein